MAEWRFLRGWSDRALRERLDRLPDLDRNFDGSHGEHLGHPAWETYRSSAPIGTVDPGPPADDGPFSRARTALVSYALSDPDIVEAHFDPQAPLLGRRMLLEIKVPLLRYLCGVVVGAVRDHGSSDSTVFGFRYDTLEGHLESGSEWFWVEKDHDSGEVTFQIEAAWRQGEFPNWWSEVGFRIVGRRYQRRWHTLCHRRMAAFLSGWPVSCPLNDQYLVHSGPEIAFSRLNPANADPEGTRGEPGSRPVPGGDAG